MECPKELDNAIREYHIKPYDFTKFSALEKIGKGGFGTVYKSEWKDRGSIIALKKLDFNSNFSDSNNSSDNSSYSDKNPIKIFAKELKNLQKVGEHPNIIKFYGVTQGRLNEFFMVLQFANHGDLRGYLKNNYSKFKWSDKLRMAREILDGLRHLHENNIIHRDLHSKNILVHNEKMLIADFGLSKDETSRTSNASVHGMSAYVDPQCFADGSYKRNKKSDIYSFGVILWEISSGRPPFQSFENRYRIPFHILEGNREIPVKGTPNPYIKLYKRCWKYDPKQRPTQVKISKTLEILSILNYSPNNISDINFSNSSVKSDYKDELNICSKVDSSKDDKIAIHASTGSNYDSDDTLKVIQIPAETIMTIDKLWNFFMIYFLNTGLLWICQPQARDLMCEQCGGFRPFIQILFNLSYDLSCMFFFFTKNRTAV